MASAAASAPASTSSASAATNGSSSSSSSSSSAPKVKVENKESKEVRIDRTAFWNRLKEFFEHWKRGGAPWAGWDGKEGAPPPAADMVDAVMLTFGPENDEVLYSRSAAIQLMFFGYDMPETIMLFTHPNTLTVLTAPKKAKLIRECGESHGEYKLIVVEKEKNTLAASYENLLKTLRGSKRGRRIGVVKKDFPKPGDEKKSTLVSKFKSMVEKSGAELVDISLALAQVGFVKDEAGLRNIRRAARYTSEVLKSHLLNSIENAIEKDERVKHSTLADKCEEVITNPGQGFKLEDKVETENVESCYTPIIMSGAGPYDLKPSASSDEKELDYTNTIIVELGARYKGYCSNIARTYFVDPTPDQKEVYTILTAVHSACLEALKAGNKASAVWLAADRLISGRKPALRENFVKNCGFGIGLEFRESELLLNKTNNTTLQAGMVFNLCIGFSDLVKGAKPGEKTVTEKKGRGVGKPYAVLMADTVVVQAAPELPEVLTNQPRAYDKVSYELDDQAKPEEGKESKEEDEVGADGVRRPRTRGAKETAPRAAQTGKMGAAQEEKIRQHQLELERKQREQALRKLASQGIDKGFKGSDVKEGKYVSYPDASAFPAEARSAKTVYVDSQNESVLCPIGGQMTPFHIQTMKNAHKSEENGWFYLRLQFHVPPTSMSASAAAAAAVPSWANHSQKFIRELTYRSKTQQLNKAFFEIQELRKRVANRLKEHQARSTLVEQEDLRVDMKRGPVAKMKDLQVKPQLTGRKGNAGFLEAHINGFRFITAQKTKIDIIYKNIKHAFFQPAEKSTLNVLLHLQLHNPIMLGKAKAKKTNYVQFFVEIMEASQDLDSRNRLDDDGHQEEQEERANRRKWNELFRNFVKKVEEHTAKDTSEAKLEFDSPYRELAFTGTPSKSIVDIMPTVHCLVALDDLPPMVVTLADVEVAILERVQFNLRNFDLVFILKGLESTVLIQAIPSKHCDSIKQWLNSCDIVFYEMAHNILWKKVLKEIKSDLQGFYEGGGWRNLSGDAEGDEGEGDEGSGSDEDAGESKSEAKGDDSKRSAASPKAKGKGKGKGKKKRKDDDDESGSEFEPSGSSDEGSDYSDEDSEVDDDDDARESDYSEGEEEDGEGEDWDTLDKKAAASDRERNKLDEEEDSKRSKKKTTKKKRDD